MRRYLISLVRGETFYLIFICSRYKGAPAAGATAKDIHTPTTHENAILCFSCFIFQNQRRVYNTSETFCYLILFVLGTKERMQPVP